MLATAAILVAVGVAVYPIRIGYMLARVIYMAGVQNRLSRIWRPAAGNSGTWD